MPALGQVIVLKTDEEITFGPHVVCKQPSISEIGRADGDGFVLLLKLTGMEIIDKVKFSVSDLPPNLSVKEIGKRKIANGIKCELTIHAEYPGDSRLTLNVTLEDEMVFARPYDFHVPPIPRNLIS